MPLHYTAPPANRYPQSPPPSRPPFNLKSEISHLRPISRPHNKRDTPANIIVLCLNHHAMFHRGTVAIQPRRITPARCRADVFESRRRIHPAPPHSLAQTRRAYPFFRIFLRPPKSQISDFKSRPSPYPHMLGL